MSMVDRFERCTAAGHSPVECLPTYWGADPEPNILSDAAREAALAVGAVLALVSFLVLIALFIGALGAAAYGVTRTVSVAGAHVVAAVRRVIRGDAVQLRPTAAVLGADLWWTATFAVGVTGALYAGSIVLGFVFIGIVLPFVHLGRAGEQAWREDMTAEAVEMLAAHDPRLLLDAGANTSAVVFWGTAVVGACALVAHRRADTRRVERPPSIRDVLPWGGGHE